MLQKNQNRLISNFNRSIPAWGRYITPAPCQPGHSLKLLTFEWIHNDINAHKDAANNIKQQANCYTDCYTELCGAIMPTITKRRRKNGTLAYRAEVRLVIDGQSVKRIKTFSDRRQAAQWANLIEAELINRQGQPEPSRDTLGELITRYFDEVHALKPLGRTTRRTLQALLNQPIADTIAANLDADSLKQHCQSRAASGTTGPSTILIDIGAISSVLKYAKAVWGIPVHPETVSEARLLLAKHGLIGRGKQRERRPTGDELDRLLAHFRKRMAHHSSLIPMADIVEFAVYSAMRQGEITRILWADVDENRQTVIIRDRKSPTQKQGNDQTIPLLGPAWEILQRQPRLDPRCFPFDERSISAAFTRTCQQLGIDNLRFHDLRREGASRLIERGFTLAEVAAVTGHRSINILHQVYTKIKPETLHERYKKNRTPK